MTHEYYIGIDPSINHTGWAWVAVNLEEKGDDRFSLLGSGVQKHIASEGDGRIAAVYQELRKTFYNYITVPSMWNGLTAIIEKPHYENTRRSKHIFQLVQACGACVCAMSDLRIPWAYILANQWKRGLPKWKIKWRVEQLFPEKKGQWAREDEYEACGLALWGFARKGEYTVWGGE